MRICFQTLALTLLITLLTACNSTPKAIEEEFQIGAHNNYNTTEDDDE